MEDENLKNFTPEETQKVKDLLSFYKRVRRMSDDIEKDLRKVIWVLLALLILWQWDKITTEQLPKIQEWNNLPPFIQVIIVILGICVFIIVAKKISGS